MSYIDIGQKARELAYKLHNEYVAGFQYSDCTLNKDASPDYAIIEDLAPDTFLMPDEATDYIDFAKADYDLSMFFKDYFASEGEAVELVRDHDERRDAELPQQGRIIILRHRHRSVEVYRMVDGVVLCNVDPGVDNAMKFGD